MKWSIGRSKYGQVDEVLNTCWDEFTEFLADAANMPLHPTQRDEHWWIAPFLVRSNRRREEDVERMAAWMGFDIDEGNVSLTTIKSKLHGLAYVAYSTTHAQPDEMRWRLLLQLDRETTPTEYRRIWRYYATKFNVDTATSNTNRIYYLPAAWEDAANVFHAQSGHPARVDSLLALIGPEPMIQPIPSPMNGATRLAPSGSTIITPHMLQVAQQAPPNGLRLWRMMCAAAVRYRVNGWQLGATELAAAALQASAIFAPGKPRPNLEREAQRAIDWAAENKSPQTPLQKMRNRILWENSRKSY